MMFMMPMPPTISEMEAMAPSTTLKIVRVRCSCLSSSSGTVISKSTTPLCRRASRRRITSATCGTMEASLTRTTMRSSWCGLVRSARFSGSSVSSPVVITTLASREAASIACEVSCARSRTRSSMVLIGTYTSMLASRMPSLSALSPTTCRSASTPTTVTQCSPTLIARPIGSSVVKKRLRTPWPMTATGRSYRICAGAKPLPCAKARLSSRK